MKIWAVLARSSGSLHERRNFAIRIFSYKQCACQLACLCLVSWTVLRKQEDWLALLRTSLPSHQVFSLLAQLQVVPRTAFCASRGRSPDRPRINAFNSDAEEKESRTRYQCAAAGQRPNHRRSRFREAFFKKLKLCWKTLCDRSPGAWTRGEMHFGRPLPGLGSPGVGHRIGKLFAAGLLMRWHLEFAIGRPTPSKGHRVFGDFENCHNWRMILRLTRCHNSIFGSTIETLPLTFVGVAHFFAQQTQHCW